MALGAELEIVCELTLLYCAQFSRSVHLTDSKRGPLPSSIGHSLIERGADRPLTDILLSIVSVKAPPTATLSADWSNLSADLLVLAFCYILLRRRMTELRFVYK